MPEQVKSNRELRCFCSHTPLIAKWDTDGERRAFLHIKVYKQRRLYSEIVVTEGNEVRVRCRNCLRWHRIRVSRKVEFDHEGLPDVIPTARSA